MDNSRRRSSSPDLERLGRKLWGYLPAIEDIMRRMKTEESTGEAGFERILQKFLPRLREGFSSESAFYADMEGNIGFIEPRDSVLVDKTLPLSQDMKTLLEHSDPLVVAGDRRNYPELQALGIQSLLVMRLDAPWGKYLVGVCNGHDEPVYPGEDKKLFKTLLEILEFGLRYGHAQIAYDRYLQAQRRGEYGFLSRASEDYAKCILRLPPDARNAQRDNRVRLDDLLADYLDAELCGAMHTFHPTSASVPKDAMDKEEPEELPDRLLVLLKLSGEHRQHFNVRLRDNKVWTEALEPSTYHRTALAVARVGLWAGYIRAGARVPECPDQQRQGLNTLPEDLCKAGEADLFWALPEKLLQKAEPIRTLPKEFCFVQECTDGLRTLWQKMHYLAHSGLLEPRHKWFKEIKNIYAQVRPLTAEVLLVYLESSASEKGLRVDSDWLATWLTSNVLLSRRLAEYYGLDDTVDSKEPISSPMERMRYITYLSQLVLYALHCARHLWREKEVQTRFEREITVQRPTFAEVPVSLSSGLSEAQLYVLSEYAYREIGVHRELDIFERLTRQLRHELSLYAVSDFYRDHLYHVIDVCLLGELLLRSALPLYANDASPHTLADSFKNCAHFNHPAQLLRNWYIAALCHDLGYVIEQTGRLLEPARSVNGPGLDEFLEAVEVGLQNGGEEIKQAVKSTLPTSPGSRVEIGDVEKVAPTDHGITAWLHLNHWLGEVKESPESLVHALDAILRHNLPAQEVNIRREPLSLLLMLCDHLQEWGRPRVGPDPLARKVIEALRFSGQAEFEQKIRTRELVVRGLKTIPPEQSDFLPQVCNDCLEVTECTKRCLRVRTQVEKEGLKFRISYVESREGDFEPAISWLFLCRDLQCLGSQDEKLPYCDERLPYPISITLEHIPPWIWRALPWAPLEMDLLQEFANTYGPARYLCEWVQKARQGEEGIRYEGNRDTGVETFTIHLDKLGRPLHRGLSDEHWRQFFKWKWQRLGQQFIGLSLGPWFPEL